MNLTNDFQSELMLKLKQRNESLAVHTPQTPPPLKPLFPPKQKKKVPPKVARKPLRKLTVSVSKAELDEINKLPPAPPLPYYPSPPPAPKEELGPFIFPEALPPPPECCKPPPTECCELDDDMQSIMNQFDDIMLEITGLL